MRISDWSSDVLPFCLTNSRGAFLAVMAMAAVWLWQRRGAVIAGILGAAGMAGMMMLPTRMQELDAGESPAYGRIESWYDGIQMFLANPVFGVGVGNFTDHTWLTAHNSDRKRKVGKACVRTCTSWWSPCNSKKKNKKKQD